ncbi:hypothetical protein U8527_20775 [Kordia algicida OT-1]|uniref:Uncharacterized protein n=1 Tax=Kordia algicida OT-1 TaxID=391587 RepID=A9DKZ3_9FLAO|nr:hypothetical protein [Kordia algicida]EDP98437.1 hypothetical protein KAOT1_14507 [Kordia algicida OT-1]
MSVHEKTTTLTDAQKELLDLLNTNEIHDYFEALKKVHYLGTYCVQKDMVELEASAYVHNLLDVVQKIVLEK